MNFDESKRKKNLIQERKEQEKNEKKRNLVKKEHALVFI